MLCVFLKCDYNFCVIEINQAGVQFEYETAVFKSSQ